ncbi:metallophosphoesterase [Cohnella sp. CFH 77786]|uniref:metallophosphoesterase n=1 Tax=Cohnella sp. CFH 77786 TaxID=2662265 RepID=UPI001C60A61D|nr:metallophosphoesterase [Cohnella sp. CFH 77786]MBW5448114.1 metallophosphoesterase [Cohnella sp. CFH 77786]
MKGRMAVVFAMFLTLHALVNLYIGWQGSIFLEEIAPAVPLGAYWIVFVLIVYAYLIGRIPVPKPVRPAARLLKVIGSYYFAVMEFAVLLLPVADLAGWLLDAAGARPENYVSIAGWGVIGFIALILVWGSRNAWSPVVRHYPVRVDKRVEGMERLRVVAASDLHLGNIVGKRHLRRLVERVNALEPDLILLPGDVIDDSIEPFVRNRLSDLLRLLKARYGVYAVLGNHEYYGGHIEEYVERMKEIAIPVLRDETVAVAGGSVIVAGRKDSTAETADPTGRLSVEKLLEGIDRSKPILLMDHQPRHFAQAAEAGVDLLLCGHTHRGQFAPNHLLTRRLFELDWGYMRKAAMHVVVSSGFGSWGPPIRIASRSEIVQIDMTFSG